MTGVSGHRPTDRRQLLVLRHAKSSWENPMLDDYDRPLAPRGKKAAQRVADRLRSWAVHPEVVLCSSARRAVDTWRHIEAALAVDAPIMIEDSLYGASSVALLRRLEEVSDDVGCVLLVGHNPGLEDLATALAGAGKRSLRDELAMKFPTAALLLLSFEGGWSDLQPGSATLEQFFKPRKDR
jgi:phosphohistidine phosphatase